MCTSARPRTFRVASNGPSTMQPPRLWRLARAEFPARPSWSAGRRPPASFAMTGRFMKSLMGTALGAAWLAVAVVAQNPAQAQSWPSSRPIKLIVPTGPGAATDVMARLMADNVTRGLGQPVVVENQGGASGLVAPQTPARAAP